MTTRVPLAALDPQERAAQCPAICQASVMARQANGRKVFSADTRATLEAAFARFSTDGPSFVLSKARIAELEQQTSESAERIRKWFDNRRIKETKNRRAAIAEAFMASQPAAAAAPPAAAAAARVVLSSDAVEAGPNQRHASYPKKPTYPPRKGMVGRAASAAGSVAAVAPAWLQATGAAPAQAASCARIVAST